MKTNFSIIIVDDDKEDHGFITNAIMGINPLHKVMSFYDGTSLMNYMEKTGHYENNVDDLPDLIILDLFIPGIDGYEVLRRIRGRSKFKKLHVFILTTCSYEYDRIKSIAYGCNNFYSKPADPKELTKIMEEIFSQVKFPSLTTSVLT